MRESRSRVPVVPALRWSDAQGYGLAEPRVERALREGVAGFIFFGGEADAAREAARELEARAVGPLLLGSDLERGAGQQFRGATPLPPLAALGALDDLEITRAAGALTGREAVELGVPWVFAPVADLDLEPDNPIVATRSFGGDPQGVSRHVRAWIEGCLAAGALPCAKHFPGHGRTLEDSHATLPSVDVSREEWKISDGVPFAAAVSAGVPSIMTAHVAYPELDPSRVPATRSTALLDGLLRRELGFSGVVVTDALVMEGAGPVATVAGEALRAGVDLLLYPPDEEALYATFRDGLPGWSPDVSLSRVDGLLAAAGRARGKPEGSRSTRGDARPWGGADARARVADWARRSLRAFPSLEPLGGDVLATSSADGPLLLCTVDDDLGGPYPPPSRRTLTTGLRERGWAPTPAAPDESKIGARHLLAVYGEPRAWKGRAGLSHEARDAVRHWTAATRGVDRCVVVFGGPRLLRDLPEELSGVLAWGGEPLMQEAVARSELPFAAGPGSGNAG